MVQRERIREEQRERDQIEAESPNELVAERRHEIQKGQEKARADLLEDVNQDVRDGASGD